MMKKGVWVMVVCLAMMVTQTADAKRLGGGKSIGQQSGNVTRRYAPPAQKAVPPIVRPNAPQPAPPVQAPPPRHPWGSMLGGLAASLGLAWLAGSMGLGAGSFGMLFLLALLVIGGVVSMKTGWFRNRSQNRWSSRSNPPFALAEAGAASGIHQPVGYHLDKVGNDASARPWEQPGTRLDGTATPQESPLSAQSSGNASTWWIPPDFDTEGFLKSAKASFVFLQAAWDRSDITALRSLVTDAMLTEIQAQIAVRDTPSDTSSVGTGGTGESHYPTSVVMLEAHLLGIEDCGDHYLASVEFSGMIRESPVEDPGPFREVWNMARPKDNTAGWLVAGVQTLQ